jgi:hypothetical protein
MEGRNINLMEICGLVRSGKAAVVRYQVQEDRQRVKAIPVEHPENIVNGDFLILNPDKKVLERESYRIDYDQNKFYLRRTPVFFGQEDIK